MVMATTKMASILRTPEVAKVAQTAKPIKAAMARAIASMMRIAGKPMAHRKSASYRLAAMTAFAVNLITVAMITVAMKIPNRHA
jgi:hypothetical protein